MAGNCLLTLILSITFVNYFIERALFVESINVLGFDITSYKGQGVLEYDENMRPKLETNTKVGFRIYGDLVGLQQIGISQNDSNCTVEPSSITDVLLESNNVGTFSMIIPFTGKYYNKYYFCYHNGTGWEHQIPDTFTTLIVIKPLIHLAIAILLIAFCVLLSAILNGLALGLMTLDLTGLKVIANAGNEKERRYGKTILKVRTKGNYLLISLVIGSTMANAVMTVLIDSFLNNWLTVTLSTIIIVLMCEILPCTIVPRYNLVIGAKTIYITRFFMIITFPVSYPLGKLLDRILGEDFDVYSKERIKELVKITSKFTNIKQLEADTITGALEMSAKKVEDVMTPIQDVYMISIETYLDYNSIAEIMRSGYTRIPIYQGERNNIVKVLHVRDLALMDPSDQTPVKLFSQLTKTECIYVNEGSDLDEVFNIFKEGVKGHMAFVCRATEDKENRDVIGVLTLEDIIEELIQVEIMDEYDSIVDNRSKRKRERIRLVADYLSAFADTFETRNVFISPHLRLATFQFLAAEIDYFRPDIVSPKVLRRLLAQGVIVHLSARKKASSNPILFSPEKAAEGFVMIIEGRGTIILGPDNLKFECGPFSYFGLLSLNPDIDIHNKYDYIVEAQGEVRFLKIPLDLYLAAKRATELDLSNTEPDLSSEAYPDGHKGFLFQQPSCDCRKLLKNRLKIERSKVDIYLCIVYNAADLDKDIFLKWLQRCEYFNIICPKTWDRINTLN